MLFLISNTKTKKNPQIMYSRKTQILFLLLSYVAFVNNAALSQRDEKDYEGVISGQGLYNAKDDVNVLTAKNFANAIHGQKYVWVVEFYNSWCGYCQRFAPSWKALGTSMKHWENMIKVGAFDCSNDENAPICRDLEIMVYPTIRYFHEDYKQEDKNYGSDVEKGQDVFSHKKNILEFMVKEQQNGRGTVFPNILPYTSNIANTFNGLQQVVDYAIVIVEDTSTFFGPEIVLDLYNQPRIDVKYSFRNNSKLLDDVSLQSYPAIIMVARTLQYKVLNGNFNTSENILQHIRQYLKTKNINIPNIKDNDAIFKGKWTEFQVPNITVLMEARKERLLKEKVKQLGDVVFQVDLETALRSSLKHEISLVKSISGEKHTALLNYLRVLEKYFPFGVEGKRFLFSLLQLVETQQRISGEEILNFVQEAEKPQRQIFSSPFRWLGCQGSTPGRRGHPCGLWKLFHYLTVNSAVDNHLGGNENNPTEVLDAMHGYIKNFFACSGCSVHFQQMAAEMNIHGVPSYDNSVLWLWEAHNKVNKRLAGDETEDGEFPKVQFPTSPRCPTCRDQSGKWIREQVLDYLKRMYRRSNIVYIETDSSIIHSTVEPHLITSGASSLFQKVDAGMIFIIYAGSFALVYVVIRIFLKRGYKKKIYSYDILGKV